MRHCLQCGKQDCRVCEYTAEPPQAPFSPELLADRDALREKLERELRFLIELEKQRRAA